MQRIAAISKVQRRHALFTPGLTVVEFGCLPGVLSDHIARRISPPDRFNQGSDSSLRRGDRPLRRKHQMESMREIERRLDEIDESTRGEQSERSRSSQGRGLLVGVDRRPINGSRYPGAFVCCDVVSMSDAQKVPLSSPPQPQQQQLYLTRGTALHSTTSLSSVLLGSRFASPEPCVDVAVMDLFDDERGDATSLSDGLRATIAAVNVVRPYLRQTGKMLLRLVVSKSGGAASDAAHSAVLRPLLRDLRARFSSAECIMTEDGGATNQCTVHLLVSGAPLDVPFARGQLHSPALLRDVPRPKVWNRLGGTDRSRSKFFVAARPAFTTAPSGLGHRFVDQQMRNTSSAESARERDEALKDFAFRMFESDSISKPRDD